MFCIIFYRICTLFKLKKWFILFFFSWKEYTTISCIKLGQSSKNPKSGISLSLPELDEVNTHNLSKIKK